ncbi:MAG: PA0069 family radical SAM protein [Steroidobacteraceae bacterium]
MKGRGALSQPAGRFETRTLERVDDGWERRIDPEDPADGEPESIATSVLPERAKSVITRNDSPDIVFDQSINPYRGCEHGCVYCYARPSHAYVGLSPGLDFESKLYYKADAAALLEKELARPGYRCRPIMLGANTDPYQPVERRLRVTRGVLEVLARCRHPVGVITKGALVERDLDLLAGLAREQLTRVMISLPTLDGPLKRILEPRAASVAARLRVIERLAAAGVPVGVMVAPVIPVLTDHEIERILEAAAGAGATRAGFIMLRLPYEVAPLFREWLGTHFPDSAAHVMSRVQDLRRGRDNDPCFGTRMSGTGAFATLVRQRFHVAARRLGMATDSQFTLPTDRFKPPVPQHDPAAGPQLGLPLG